MPSSFEERIAQANIALRTRVVGPALKPGPTLEITALTVLGAHPKDLAPGLTRREASEFCTQTEYANPKDWLMAQVKEECECCKTAANPTSIEVVRWCQGIVRDPERLASANRIDPVMGDDTSEGTLWSRLDEIQTQDLRKSVRGTLTAAVSRQIRESWSGEDLLCKKYSWEDELPEGCFAIRTFTRLFKEGKEMRHCISSYAEYISTGQSVIISIRNKDGRSTLDAISGQCVGFANKPYTHKHEDIVLKCIDIVRGRNERRRRW